MKMITSEPIAFHFATETVDYKDDNDTGHNKIPLCCLLSLRHGKATIHIKLYT